MGTAEKMGKAVARAVFYVNKAGEVLDCRNRGEPPQPSPDQHQEEKVMNWFQPKEEAQPPKESEPQVQLFWQNQPEKVIVGTQLEFGISVDPQGHTILGFRLLANSDPVSAWTTNQRFDFWPETPGQYCLQAELFYQEKTAVSNLVRIEVLEKEEMWEQLLSQVSQNPDPIVRLIAPRTFQKGKPFPVEMEIDPGKHRIDGVEVRVDGEIKEYLVKPPYHTIVVIDEPDTHRLTATVHYDETQELETPETEVFEMTAPDGEEPRAQNPPPQEEGGYSPGAQPFPGPVPPPEPAPPVNFPPPQTQPPNEPPTIRLYSPDIRQGLIPHQIRLVAEVQSNGHSINGVFFRDNDGSFLGSIRQEPYVLPWTPSPGVHNVRAQLEYDDGEVLSNGLTIAFDRQPVGYRYHPPVRQVRDRGWIGDALIILGALVALGVLGALTVMGVLSWLPAAVAAIFIVAIATLFLLGKWGLGIATLALGAVVLLLFFALPSLDGIRGAIQEDGDKTRETVTSEHDKTRQTLTSEIEEEGEAVRDHVTKEHEKTRATVKSEAEKTRSQMTTTTVRRPTSQSSTVTTRASAPSVVAPPLVNNPASFETDLGFNDVGVHTAAPSAGESSAQTNTTESQEQNETTNQQEENGNTDITDDSSGYTAPPSASD